MTLQEMSRGLAPIKRLIAEEFASVNIFVFGEYWDENGVNRHLSWSLELEFGDHAISLAQRDLLLKSGWYMLNKGDYQVWEYDC